MIHLITIDNPFDARTRKTRELAYAGSRIDDYVPSERRDEPYRTLLNGIKVSGRTKVHDGDTVLNYKMVGDDVGGVLKKVFWDYDPFVMLFKGIGSLFKMGGNLPSYGSGSHKSSPTYAWDGIKNTVSVGIPVGICYGEHFIGGNYINTYISQAEEKNYLNVLIGLCEGPIQSVGGLTADTDNADISAIGSNILVDGNPISDYQGVEAFVRLGSDDQNIIPGFHDLNNQRPQSSLLSQNVALNLTGETGDMEAFELSFEWPALYTISGGEYKPATETVEIYYKLTTDAGYTKGPDLVVPDVEATNSAIRRSYRIDNLTPGQYQFQLIKRTANSHQKRGANCNLTNINEIRYEPLRYPFTALLGLRILATSQLSGGLPNILTKVKGLKVDVWDGSGFDNEWSRNPIWCLYDMLTNARYGLGNLIDDDSLNLDQFKAMATVCDELVTVHHVDGVDTTEAQYELDIVLDDRSPALDLIIELCLTFACWPIWSGGGIYPVIDKEETQVMAFGMGNIVEKSFNETFKSIRETPNIVEVQYNDRDNRFEMDTVSAETTDLYTNIAGIRKTTTHLRGVTRRSQALRRAQRMLAHERSEDILVEFETGTDALVCQVGDVIRVAHDIPAWGLASGRVGPPVSGMATDEITLADDIVLAPQASGEWYYLGVRFANDTLQVNKIISPAGTYDAGDVIVCEDVWTTTPSDYDVYSLGLSAELWAKPFRVQAMSRESNGTVKITCREYQASVYDETGLTPDVDYSALPDPRETPPPVENLTAVVSSGYDWIVLLSWTLPALSVDYGGTIKHVEIWISYDGGDTYVFYGNSTGSTMQIPRMPPSRTIWFKAVSVSTYDVKSDWASAPTTSVWIETIVPRDVKGLELRGQGNDVIFSGKDAVFQWKEHSIGAESNPDFANGVQDAYFSHYHVEIWSLNDAGYGIQRRIETTVTPEYTYTWEKNLADHGGTAKRAFTIAVWQVDIFGQGSPNIARLNVANLEPGAPEDIDGWTQSGIILNRNLWTVSWSTVVDKDLIGYNLYLRYSISDPWTLIYTGLHTQYSFSVLTVISDIDVKAVGVDGFGESSQYAEFKHAN